jgi:hypothetical protein
MGEVGEGKIEEETKNKMIFRKMTRKIKGGNH